MSNWNLLEQDNDKFFDMENKLQSSLGTNEDTQPWFDAVIDSLSSLSLLYNVPFAYLVPVQNMLEDNKIKFFYLDANWIRVLMDGACSLGRVAEMDYSNDVRFLKEVCKNALTANQNVRRKLQGKSSIDMSRLMTEEDVDIPVCTGFLLRSELVAGWRGLEFIAYGDAQEENSVLTALRLETISKDILLGIYQGVIKKLEIKQPPEGFHYGFNRYTDSGKTILKKSLRSIEDGKLLYKDGKSVQIEVVERKNRVINFKETAKAMGENTDLFKSQAKDTVVNSSHIALEMIQNPYVIQVIAKE